MRAMMNTPSVSTLLDAWERGTQHSQIMRALLLLAAACPGESLQALAQHSIGERDARLLNLREALFGSTLMSLAQCPRCKASLELAFETANVRTQSEQMADVLVIDSDAFSVRCRLPNSNDLLALTTSIARGGSMRDSRRALLARCVIAARCGDEPTEVNALPERVVSAIAQRMAEADPQADVQLALNCPSCGHGWNASFDIAAYVWAEIDAWARRMLREVHALASAYGWREADILRLSPSRRRAYLDLIGAR